MSSYLKYIRCVLRYSLLFPDDKSWEGAVPSHESPFVSFFQITSSVNFCITENPLATAIWKAEEERFLKRLEKQLTFFSSPCPCNLPLLANFHMKAYLCLHIGSEYTCK